MATRGSVAKQEVASKILAAFPGSFLYNDGKEIRINWTEDGENLQIKVSLTCAKVAVEGGEDNAIPGDAATAPIKPAITSEKVPQEPSEEEKERLAALLTKLGL